MSIAYITHAACGLHDMGKDHPESPQRLSAIQDALIEAHLMELVYQYDARPAKDEELMLVHDQDYLSFLKQNAPKSGTLHLDMDTAMNPHSLEAAYRAAGAATMGIDLIMNGDVTSCFCAVRPPGHHAERDHAMGFCFFNNVAIAAAYTLKTYDLERIVVLDFDVHHGNGTEHMLSHDPRILICSSFQHPYYPGKPFIQRDPRIINVPLPQYTESKNFRQAITDQWFPAIEQFRPQLILVSAGFDAHHDDPLAELNLTSSDFGWLAANIHSFAQKTAQGRVLTTLEGGYNLKALGDSVVAYLRPFLGLL